MWNPSYEIVVETLTGSEFEVTVSDRDTVGYIKSKIQKYEGIPVNQQHLLYNHKELNDATEMKDIPLVNGSRLKLVLGMKGGPISSKRVVTISDYENWFDMSDMLSRQDAANFKTPGLKLLVNRKNIHRLMKVRAEKVSDNIKISRVVGHQSNGDIDSEELERETQKERDDKITAEKLTQIKTKLNMKKLKLATAPIAAQLDKEVILKEERMPITRPTFSAGPIGSAVPHHPRPRSQATTNAAPSRRDPFLPHITSYQNFHTAISRQAELDRHSQIRENLQRNRSFKTISAKNLNVSAHDMTVHDSSRLERSLSFHSNGILNRTDSDPTGSSRNAYNSQSQHQLSSASLHDIIELLKYTPSKLRTISHDALNKMVSKKAHHHASAKLLDNSSLKNIDEFIRDYDVTMTNHRMKTATATTTTGVGDCTNLLAESMFNKDAGFASAELAFDKAANTGALDKTFRTLYKSTSDDNSTYELPKLLIREDSPVESFHSSYPQLETVALRGESPKNFNSIAKLQNPDTAGMPENATSLAPGGMTKANSEKTKLASSSLLQLYEHPPPAAAAAATAAATAIGGSIASGAPNSGTWAPHYGGIGHHHHHSDLGINELELKFINNGLIEKDASDNNGSSSSSSNSSSNSNNSSGGAGSIFRLPAVSNLEINHWNAVSNDSVNNFLGGSRNGDKQKEEELVSNPRTSNGFIHSDLSISSDEDDLFSISDLIYKNQANKSKSIDLNEFRKTFGSSPTLLNNFGGTNCNLVPQLSRLDAIPSQYRRGYTNLNDAGLSSSTSELECVNATTKKKTGTGDNAEMSPLLKHRSNDHVAYVRSYENLNRYKGFSMKNGDASDILRCQQGAGQLLPGISNLDSIADSDLNSSNESGSNLVDDSFTDFEYRFSRLSCSGGNIHQHGNCSSSSNITNSTQTNSSQQSGCSHSASGGSNRMPSLNDLNHRNRTLHGYSPFNNTSSPFNNSNSAANYYFPSDESLFNIDSFFDDFVEIDTSDIFDSAEYINIGGSSRNANNSSKMLQKPNNPSLLLPDLMQQEELLLKTQLSFPEADDLLTDGGASHLSTIHHIDGGEPTVSTKLDDLDVTELPPLKVRVPPLVEQTSPQRNTAIHHQPAEPLKSKKLRCAQCNRKLGVIMIMKCHCEKIFCAQHRYAEAHNCSYDFKLNGKKILERENPLVVAHKLPKI
ncbi:uncharacterized protein LOC128742017 [Sabethes cyaneus]|uniref:uncharacterized protein LOC128742017 n=1 Tax=Sabethes cyaneus TaxID=53552 RepID=UPI00237EA577|nr:uncharacterized protein LOC128742017 [Sabethes cyaneus]